MLKLFLTKCFLFNFVFSGVFNESTARGLEFYAKDHQGFLETSRFVTFILNIWKIVSVKSPSKGMSFQN